jgi:hypothetical protein
VSDTATEGVIERESGPATAIAHDLAARMPAASIQAGLRAKAKGLIGIELADRFWAAVADLDRISARDLGAMLRKSD